MLNSLLYDGRKDNALLRLSSFSWHHFWKYSIILRAEVGFLLCGLINYTLTSLLSHLQIWYLSHLVYMWSILFWTMYKYTISRHCRVWFCIPDLIPPGGGNGILSCYGDEMRASLSLWMSNRPNPIKLSLKCTLT